MYKVGEKVTTKKQHPCGSNTWVITRTGADFKLKCTGCEHSIMVSSEKLKKMVKE